MAPPDLAGPSGIHIVDDIAAIQQLCAHLSQLPCFAFELDTAPDALAASSALSFSSELALPDAPANQPPALAAARAAAAAAAGARAGAAPAAPPVPAAAPKEEQFAVSGLALCSQDGCAAYIPLSRATPAAAWQAIGELLGRPGSTKVTFSLKQQLLALHQLRKQLAGCAPGCQAPEPADHLVDVRIAAWLLYPDSSTVHETKSSRAKTGGAKSATKVLESILERWFGGSSSMAAALQGLQGSGRTRQRYLDQCKRVVLARKAFETLKVRAVRAPAFQAHPAGMQEPQACGAGSARVLRSRGAHGGTATPHGPAGLPARRPPIPCAAGAP
jgi:hypothetical protein